MDTDRATAGRRFLLVVVMVATAWAAVIAVTGGFAVSVAGIRFSSRSLRNPLLLALVSASAAAALSRWNRDRPLRDDFRWLSACIASALGARRPRLRLLLPATAAMGGAVLQILDWARARPLWLDEEMIALNVRDRSIADLAGPLWLDQSAPLGWLGSERAALLLFGQSERVLRALPLAFGLATLAVAVWVGRRWFGTLAATTLVLLLALGRWVFYYALELKPYSTDTFFGLLLPALAVWAVEADGPRLRLRRATLWWCAAAVGVWWANGALLVAPACALLLMLAMWRIDGVRSAGMFAAGGVLWFVSAGFHYLAALRFALGNEVLREVWSFAFPPASAGIGEHVAWTLGQAAPFAASPGGTDLALLFWGAALGGVLLGRPSILGASAAAVVFSAPVLAALRLVPVYERFSLWTVPALYLAIALCVDVVIRWARAASAARRFVSVAAALLVLVVVLRLSADIAAGGWREVVDPPRRSSNHQLDDRAGVRWLLAQRQPGDAVLTTTLALPAVWWYGGVSLAPPEDGQMLPEGTPILEVSYQQPGRPCDAAPLGAALAAHRRALVYFGFRFDDVPVGFDDLLLGELEQIGRVSATRSFAGVARVVVVDFGGGSRPAAARPSVGLAPLKGCVSVKPATRW